MGVHSGPVSGVIDVNGHANLAGDGLNMAQRVMACGDTGHILLSKHVAEDLEEYERWRPLLHSLGECEVKHGVRITMVNLYTDQVGNPQLPKKLQALKKHSARMRWAAVTAALALSLENLSEEKENAFFADGIQDELLSSLSKIKDLKVNQPHFGDAVQERHHAQSQRNRAATGCEQRGGRQCPPGREPGRGFGATNRCAN
jgi:hypothetical protein